MSEKTNYEITEGYDREVLLEVLRNFDNSGESVNEERNRKSVYTDYIQIF